MPKNDVLMWRRKWGVRLMHPEDMSRARRGNLMQEVDDMVSIRDRTIEALLTAAPESPHLEEIKADARALIGADADATG